MRKAGTYQLLGDINYFIPAPLPPNPPLEWSEKLVALSNQASDSLARVNEMARKLRNPERFIRAYLIKEALLSSEIEGIHTTLIDVFTQALDGSKINKDTQLVLNYIEALKVAVKMIKEKRLPIVTRVILEAHRVLMSTGEGERATPGQFRKQSVKVGGLVPPPAPEIPELMRSLEKFMNEQSVLPALIKAGLAHVQFETIHPFLDGNGRIGRLLIVLMLIKDKRLADPIIYPSLYFKKHHLQYYQHLDRVRTHGDFEGWMAFYLEAISFTASEAYVRAMDIEDLERQIIHLIDTSDHFAKKRETSLLLLDYLFIQPITNITAASKAIGRSYNAVEHILDTFETLHYVHKFIKGGRYKTYEFKPYLQILEKDY